jgi:glycosyltransferase involved in cell wall biosynthesis
MMHILFVTGEYPPLRGGVGAYTAELGHALGEQGVQISVLTSHRVQASTGPITVYPLIKRWDWSIWRRIRQHAQSIGADWIHIQYQTAAYTMHPAINFAPWYWRRQGRAFHVAWTYHDLLVPYLFPKAGAHLRRWVTERPAHSSDLVIVTNEGDRLALALHKLPAINIPIGSNIAGRRLNAAERQQRRQQRGYTDADLVIGYFGFLNHSKGGLTLVQTLDQLVQAGHNAHLLMIGERVGSSDPTNFAYLQAVERLIAQHDLTARVQWTGHQPAAEVSADLGACDLLLLPYVDGASLRRGTLLAALAHGCAIVTTTPRSPLPELVDGRDLIFVAPEDAEAAATAIRRLVATPQLQAELRAQAYRTSQQFTWPRIAAQHLAHYQTAAGDK